MYVFNSKTKAGRTYLERIWSLRSCQAHHLQLAVWRRTNTNAASRFCILVNLGFEESESSCSSVHCGVIEPSNQLHDQHFEQLQSHCSSIVLRGKVKGHSCLCSFNGETQPEEVCG